MAHYQQLQTLLRRVEEAELIWAKLDQVVERYALNPRAVASLYDAILGLRIRHPSYRSAIHSATGEEITEQTTSRDLKVLADSGLLMAHGERRGRYYPAGPEVQALRAALMEKRSRGLADPFHSVGDR